MRYHTWAEFLIPEHGWLPADPTYGNSQFGKLNNKRIIASVGNNIQLKHAHLFSKNHLILFIK